MVGSFVRLAAAGAFCIALAGCASGPDYPDYDDSSGGYAGGRDATHSPLQCVPYARDHSGVAIYGDAYTWWDKAEGRFARSTVPSEGSVMVLYNYAGPNRGHVAVVREVVDSRTIRIDHANWLDDGAIYTDDPVRDESPDNDWSRVRVFNLRTHTWGGRIYPVQGFIGPGTNRGDVMVAQNPAPPRGDAIAALLADDAATDDETLN
jgi:surface antigen